jgi:hypothetical protein
VQQQSEAQPTYVDAHAAILATRSPVLRRQLLSLKRSATAQPAGCMPDEFEFELAVPTYIGLGLLQVLLEYIYLDRLTLCCDRERNDNCRWLELTAEGKDALAEYFVDEEEELSKGKIPAVFFGPDDENDEEHSEGSTRDGTPSTGADESGSKRERPSVEERAISEDEYESLLLAEEDDFRRREAAQKAAKLIECTHAPSVLSECRNILRVAVQLRLPHLCSLVLARIKSLITPATVIAVAEMAHSVVESEMTKGGKYPFIFSIFRASSEQETPLEAQAATFATNHGDDATSACSPEGTDKNADGNETDCSSLSDTPTAKSSLVAADGLLKYCVHYLVSHLELTIAALGHLNAGTPRSLAFPNGWLRRRVLALRQARRMTIPTDEEIRNQQPCAAENESDEQARTSGTVISRTTEENEQEEDDDAVHFLPEEPDRATGILKSRLIPTCTGHTSTSILDGTSMLVMGGSNREQFHALRNVLIYSPRSGNWCKVKTTGPAPNTLIYHTTTPLEPPPSPTVVHAFRAQQYTADVHTQDDDGALLFPPRAAHLGPRNVLVFGGIPGDQNTRQLSSIYVLDCLTMQWRAPKVSTSSSVFGDASSPGISANVRVFRREMNRGGSQNDGTGDDGGPCHRTRHSMVSLHAPVEPYSLRPPSHALASVLILFGGYSQIRRNAFHDIWLLEVLRKPSAPEPTSTAAAADDDDFLGTMDGNLMRGEEEHAYDYAWRKPAKTTGERPDSRLAHSAVMIPRSDDGRRISHMVIFGGVGLGAIFNDIHILSCGELDHALCCNTGEGLDASRRLMSHAAVHWQDKQVEGEVPSPRYGHTMKLLTHSLYEVVTGPSSSELVTSMTDTHRHIVPRTSAQLLLFGGTTGDEVFNDLFILTVDLKKLSPVDLGSTGSGAHVRWSSPRVGTNPSNTSIPPQMVAHPDATYSSYIPESEGAGDGDGSDGNHPDRFRAESPPRSPGNLTVIPDAPDSPSSAAMRAAAAAAKAAVAEQEHAQSPTRRGVAGGSSSGGMLSTPSSLSPIAESETHRLNYEELHANLSDTFTPVAAPFPRSRHDMCEDAFTGSMILFGGSDEGLDRRSANGSGRPMHADMDNAVFVLHGGEGQSFRDYIRANDGPSQTLRNRTAVAHDEATSPSSPADEGGAMEWTNPRSHVFEAGAEPIIAWHPSSLLADLSGLVNNDEFSDVTFQFDDTNGQSMTGSDEDEAAIAAATLRRLNGDDSTESENEDDTRSASAPSGASTKRYTLHAHRMLLSLQNHPIRAMLNSGMREATSSHVRLHASVGRAAFTAVLAFLYTDSLLFPIFEDVPADETSGSEASTHVHVVDAVVASPSPETVMDILYLANQYTMRRLEALCEGLLLRLADAEHNAAALYEFADLLNLPNLKTAVRSVAFRDAHTWHEVFCRSEGFACLAPSIVEELNRHRTTHNHMYSGQLARDD